MRQSNGFYRSSDVRFHFETPDGSPKIGSTILDADGSVFTILETSYDTIAVRWKCICRNLTIHYGLDSVVTIDEVAEADFLVTSKSYYRRKSQRIRDAEASGLPIYVLKSSTPAQVRQCLNTIATSHSADFLEAALREAEEAATEVLEGGGEVELSPQSAFIRRLQHQIAERSRLASSSIGKEPRRRVRIFRGRV